METLRRLVRAWLGEQQIARIVWELLKSDRPRRVWIALFLVLCPCYVLLWQVIEPWGLPDFIVPLGLGRGCLHLLVSLLLALVIMLCVVDHLRRWQWEQQQHHDETEDEVARGGETAGAPGSPRLPDLPSGAKRILTFRQLEYKPWIHQLKLQSDPGTLIASGEIRELHPHTGQLVSAPPFAHLEAFMGALSVCGIPSLMAAQLVVYRRTKEGSIRGRVTAHFRFHQVPATAELVATSEGGNAWEESTVKSIAARLAELPGVTDITDSSEESQPGAATKAN